MPICYFLLCTSLHFLSSTWCDSTSGPSIWGQTHWISHHQEVQGSIHPSVHPASPQSSSQPSLHLVMIMRLVHIKLCAQYLWSWVTSFLALKERKSRGRERPTISASLLHPQDFGAVASLLRPDARSCWVSNLSADHKNPVFFYLTQIYLYAFGKLNFFFCSFV